MTRLLLWPGAILSALLPAPAAFAQAPQPSATCKVHAERAPVAQALAAKDVADLVGDPTSGDAEIARSLKSTAASASALRLLRAGQAGRNPAAGSDAFAARVDRQLKK